MRGSLRKYFTVSSETVLLRSTAFASISSFSSDVGTLMFKATRFGMGEVCLTCAYKSRNLSSHCAHDLWTCCAYRLCWARHFLPTLRMTSTLDTSAMTLRDKHFLALKLLGEIDDAWSESEDTVKWQEQNVENYEATMSFDELVAEVAAVEFKSSPSQQ